MKINIEEILFDFKIYVEAFEEHLKMNFLLTDAPYNVKGKEFSKKGDIEIDGEKVSYQFHGGGCTFFWGDTEVSYNFDASASIHKICISCYPISRFINTYPKGMNSELFEQPYPLIHPLLEDLEKKGVLMKRKPSDLGLFHINEVWYEAYRNGMKFTGENKNDIDWL